MKGWHKQCKTTRQVNAFLKGIGGHVAEFGCFDEDYTFPVEFEVDGWVNEAQTRGVSLRVSRDTPTGNLEVFVNSYSRKDIDRFEADILEEGGAA
jgi:hypothetical protein